MKKLLALATLVFGTLFATPAFARSISFEKAGLALWIFVIIGGIIILLQLIPATILFFSFIGTTSKAVYGKKTEVEEIAGVKEEVV